jgi:peptidoglycan/xylan/chitin deacetylase (PgdA/CDA1 family)
MKRYLAKTPWWLKLIFPSYVWDIKTKEKVLYLTFDDGPHPVATPFVLDQLKKYNAKATFFCIGKNVLLYPEIYQRIIEEGHAIGNHTQNHLNGWKSGDDVYMADITEASKHIDSTLFRPPYGRITSFQAKHVKDAMRKPAVKIIMWNVLSGDFDETITAERCSENVILNAKKGSIIVFHDSKKAFPRLEPALPEILKFFGEKGMRFKKMGEL